MKLTKILTILLALVLAVSVCISLVACGGGDGDGDNGDNTADQGGNNDGGANNGGTNNGGTDNGGTNSGGDNTGDNGGNNGGDNGSDNGGNQGGGEDNSEYFSADGELILFDEGVPTFKFVTGNDVGTNAQALAALAETLTDLSADGSTVAVATSNSDITAVEILVGSVNNRGAEYKFNKYDLGAQGYMVKQVGTKIIVQGGSPEALGTAIQYLKDKVFGIKKNNDPFDYYTMSATLNKEYVQDDYSVKSITIAGNSIKDYIITYDALSKSTAQAFRDNLYLECGVYLDAKSGTNVSSDTKKISFKVISNTGKSAGFFAKVEGEDLVISCEISDFLADTFNTYIESVLFGRSGAVEFSATYSENVDIRNITYEQFGANGNDENCDYAALKAAHDHANRYKLIVHASADATYYIGKNTGSRSIEIQTDTYWHGCSFVIDDKGLDADDVEFHTPFMRIESSNKNQTIEGDKIPISSLYEGATNIGYAPGFKALIIVYNSNVQHYIRGGNYADSGTGNDQQEVLIVEADGTISSETPIQWDYDTITKLEVLNIEDEAIIISGGDDENNKALFTTIFNETPFYSDYDRYSSRVMYIRRSNVKLINFEHAIVGEDSAEAGAPYNGFTNVAYADNVRFENITYQRYRMFVNTESGFGTARSYEIRVGHCNNVVYYNCDQSNFFHDGLRNANNGMMGTNYSKNLKIEKCKFNTFDAHQGVYNATIKDCTLVYISIIGEGTLTVEDVTFYAARTDQGETTHAIWIRSDYGSTFEGTFILKDVTIKYDDYEYRGSVKTRRVNIIDAVWTENYYGYQTYLPENIYIENLNAVKIKPYYDDFGVRQEQILGTNIEKIYLYPSGISDTLLDLSQNKVNPYIGTKNVYITNTQCEIGMPTSPMFKDLKVYIDNVLQ